MNSKGYHQENQSLLFMIFSMKTNEFKRQNPKNMSKRNKNNLNPVSLLKLMLNFNKLLNFLTQTIRVDSNHLKIRKKQLSKNLMKKNSIMN